MPLPVINIVCYFYCVFQSPSFPKTSDDFPSTAQGRIAFEDYMDMIRQGFEHLLNMDEQGIIDVIIQCELGKMMYVNMDEEGQFKDGEFVDVVSLSNFIKVFEFSE